MFNYAVVIAGGRGLRLEKITEEIPKSMIPVLGKPMLHRIIAMGKTTRESILFRLGGIMANAQKRLYRLITFR